MLVLNHITIEDCPVCHAEVVEEHKRHQHSNGDFNEYRKFQCGNSVTYSPNFKRCTEDSCPHDPIIQLKTDRRIASKEKVIKYISKLEADTQFKKYLTNAINGVGVK